MLDQNYFYPRGEGWIIRGQQQKKISGKWIIRGQQQISHRVLSKTSKQRVIKLWEEGMYIMYIYIII